MEVTIENKNDVCFILYGNIKITKSKSWVFQVGDVSIKQKLTFEKEYEANRTKK